MRKKVLIMAGYYIPSVKGGGPIQSIKNLVDNLSDKIDFYIIASDRDLGDDRPFENIKTDEWISVGNAKVYYVDKSTLTFKKIKGLIDSIDLDILYLNSFFDYRYGILPILLNKTKSIQIKKIIIAPRGQFSSGALSLKYLKKIIYIMISKLFRLYKDVIWHATNKIEQDDIERIFGTNISMKIANNLTPNYYSVTYNKKINKTSGELKLVYISRIHPMKNLLQVLNILRKFDAKIEFNIYGPIEDQEYWRKCKELIDLMSSEVRVNYNGLIAHDKVNEIYHENHISILLTFGENFGHAISEALIGGCPIIISDKTPWRNVQSFNSGWDLPLDNSDLIEEKIKYFVELDDSKYKEMSKSAFEYGKNKSNQMEDIDAYYEMLSN